MRKWRDLTQEEKNEIICKALDWQSEHKEHMTRLVKTELVAYAPSGSDMLHPELWKPAHWKWFDLGGGERFV